MSAGLNAAQARAKANQDMIIYNEIDAIMKEILTQSAAGTYIATVNDGTTMTDSSPETVITGSVATPTIVPGATVIINGSTITLGTTGTNLNSIIADINDAAIAGIVASKNTTNNLIITITQQPSTTWSYIIGAGTANTALGLTAGTFSPSTPTSVNYHDTWQGVRTNRGENTQMNAVIKYFENLGYKIERSSNVTSSSTFQWNVYW